MVNNFNKHQQIECLNDASNSLVNNSGTGKDAPVLDIIAKKFNWGAFFLSWVWGLGNKSYITLVILPIAIFSIIPVLGIIMQICILIWFGLNGNKWAWQNKKWKSIEEFHNVQKKWAIIGIIFETLFIIIMISIGLLMPMLVSNSEEARIKKLLLNSTQDVLINKINGTKCNASEEELAKCFIQHLYRASIENSEIKFKDGSIWKFVSNGNCKNKNDCRIVLYTSYAGTMILPLYIDSNGNIDIKEKDIKKYIK